MSVMSPSIDATITRYNFSLFTDIAIDVKAFIRSAIKDNPCFATHERAGESLWHCKYAEPNILVSDEGTTAFLNACDRVMVALDAFDDEGWNSLLTISAKVDFQNRSMPSVDIDTYDVVDKLCDFIEDEVPNIPWLCEGHLPGKFADLLDALQDLLPFIERL